jgi:PAS domain S-box-containing protein
MDLAVSELQLSDRRMFTGIVRDVTSRKQMECDLLDREHRYRSLVETAASVILFLSPDGEVREWNREAERIFGYARDEVLGKNYFEMMLPDEVRAAVSDEIDLVLSGRPSRDYENPVVTQDGQQRVLSWNATRMQDADGKIQGLVAVGQDITDLTEARKKLLQSERLAAMGEMLSGIAHESRNALQRIQAGADMLDLEIGDNKEAKEDLARITRAREDLNTLFEELRNFAAPVHLNRSDCDLGNIWRRSWTHLESVRENRVAELNEGSKEIDLKCKVDAFRMEQVFRNLIENSLAACDDPVHIDLDCEHTLLKNEPAIHVSFRDNGPGLTDEQQAKIFDAFYTTKTKGTGLGMAIARRIIEAHQGEIRVGPRDAGVQIELVIPR